MTSIERAPMYSFIFPGQGAQKVGMGQALYETSPAARSVFEEADDSLGVNLSQVMFEGPTETLQDTAYTQPAIMTVSIAIWRAWQEFLGASAPQPMAVAGHSLGEYTSMVVGGVMDFSDGVRLVRERGRLMHEASEARPGSMAAIIGLDEIVVAQVAQDAGVELANINSDDQIVISGDKMALARAMDLASARGAKKVVPLAVSGAFHSRLMELAQEGLTDAIDGITLRDPRFPVVANSTGAPITNAEQARQELLTGLCNCVLWKHSVQLMINSGANRFVEFGPARVLSSLVRRIDPGVEALTLSDPDSIRKVTTE
ncbi:MAG: ACP S-malonyltransferase [Chloroflexi bacterium]|nr:ACP S-malonyltransferase [Chloroflexota bacterium]